MYMDDIKLFTKNKKNKWKPLYTQLEYTVKT